MQEEIEITDNMGYSRIALLMAMYDEALSIIEYYNLEKDGFYNPIEVYANKDKSIILSLNGQSLDYEVDNIGSQAASINAYVTIDHYNPDLIINCGTAGGFVEQNTKIGDVFIAKDYVCYHDRRISLSENFKNYGFGYYPVINSDVIAPKFNLKQGIISTGDSFDITESDLKTMIENKASVKEMESAAIAWICSLRNIDFTAIKAITDFVDLPETTNELFLKNLELASNNLKEKIIHVIDYFLK